MHTPASPTSIVQGTWNLLGNLMPTFIRKSLSPERKSTLATPIPTAEDDADNEEEEAEENETAQAGPVSLTSSKGAIFDTNEECEGIAACYTPDHLADAD